MRVCVWPPAGDITIHLGRSDSIQVELNVSAPHNKPPTLECLYLKSNIDGTVDRKEEALWTGDLITVIPFLPIQPPQPSHLISYNGLLYVL